MPTDAHGGSRPIATPPLPPAAEGLSDLLVVKLRVHLSLFFFGVQKGPDGRDLETIKSGDARSSPVGNVVTALGLNGVLCLLCYVYRFPLEEDVRKSSMTSSSVLFSLKYGQNCFSTLSITRMTRSNPTISCPTESARKASASARGGVEAVSYDPFRRRLELR